MSCDGCGDYSGVITSLIGHNRVIVSQTSEAVVVWGAEMNVLLSWLFPQQQQFGDTGSVRIPLRSVGPSARGKTAVLETDEW